MRRLTSIARSTTARSATAPFNMQFTPRDADATELTSPTPTASGASSAARSHSLTTPSDEQLANRLPYTSVLI